MTEVYWIYAIRKKGDYPKRTTRSGKWLIFINKKDVDEVWAKIKKATEEGKLGDSSKVATAKPNPLNAANQTRRSYAFTPMIGTMRTMSEGSERNSESLA